MPEGRWSRPPNRFRSPADAVLDAGERPVAGIKIGSIYCELNWSGCIPVRDRCSKPHGQGEQNMAVQASRRQHYLPQHYLRGFTSGLGDDCIWQYEKQAAKGPICVQVKDVGVQGYFYSYVKTDGTRDVDSFEKSLSLEVEGPAHEVLNRIRRREMIRISEKEILAVYIDYMHRRVPRHPVTSRAHW
jgi:hypothetical protein